MNIRQLKPHIAFFVLLAAGLYLLAFSAGPVHATDAVVGTGTPQSCTEAAFDSALAVVQASQDGEISFNCGGEATIIFTEQKNIAAQLLIINGGGEITLSGGNTNRLFYVVEGNLELRGITLANGYVPGHGGAIYAANNTSVYLLDSTIRNSRADSPYGGGAILSFDTSTNFPSVEIVNSVIEFNESGFGAINTIGKLVVRDSIIRGNRALDAGGGLSVNGVIEIVNTDIVDNEAVRSVGGGLLAGRNAVVRIEGGRIRGNKGSLGGGVYNAGQLIMRDLTISDNFAVNSTGGGLENYGGNALMIGVTFSGNSSLRGGGAIGNGDGGSVDLQNSTLSGNDVRVAGDPFFGGGAIFNYESFVNMINSTLVDNVGVAEEAIVFPGNSGQLSIYNTIMVSRGGDNCRGMPSVNISYSLFDDDTCKYTSGTGNIYEFAFVGELADNGGPTLTHMIASFSPAINTGDCLFEFDQRGVERPQGGACDIGAVERRSQEGEGFLLYLPVGLK